ncbi:nucleotidyltransferase domain-containing protein [Streptomyces sp. NPDC002734]|uniref:nucleotidyltransferase domain-containing protein n=1 Tax=Streptomyces sp. NPDC002734 TaxID=3154426 RepID=UPI00331DC5D1
MSSRENEPTSAPAAVARIRDRLARLPGVTGVVLGGSHARGAARPDSDLDIGLYYDPAARPGFDLVLAAAAELDDHGAPLGHGAYGEWGPWINGGVWLIVDGTKTDILLRDHDRVDTVLRQAAEGTITVDHQPGHPHGFVSTIYAGEVRHNVPLHDPRGRLAASRALVDPYPAALREAVEGRFGWEAGFSLANAGSPARRGDITQVTGLLYQAVACMNQVVFARNGRFVVNEKGATAEADALPVRPERYRERIEAALGGLSTDPSVLTAAVDALRAVHDDLSQGAASR